MAFNRSIASGILATTGFAMMLAGTPALAAGQARHPSANSDAAHGPQRLVDKAPHGHWKLTTFIAALRHDRLTAPMVIDRPMNGEIFLAYVLTFLLPTLSAGDIVVMDNLSSHKVTGVAEAIEAAGARVMYLPPYSPDLNPIEQVFAKLKALLRKAKERTIDNLWDRIGKLVDEFSAQECANYFVNAGYGPT